MQLNIQYLNNYPKTWDRIHFKHVDDSGLDLRAAIKEPKTIKAKTIEIIPCGIKVELMGSDLYEIQVRARSGLAFKNGIGLVNGIGTIDFGYRGEIQVALFNLSNEDFIINPGDRIAQMVICPIVRPMIMEVDAVNATHRNDSGFGSTGVA